MKKKLLIIVSIIFITLLMGVFMACATDGTRPTGVTVENTIVYLGLEGPARTHQIGATVHPASTANQAVRFRPLDNEAAKFFSVSASGLLTANNNGLTTPSSESEDFSYIVRVESIDDPGKFADVHVHVMSAEPVRITFANADYRVIMDAPAVEIVPIVVPYFASVELEFEILSADPANPRATVRPHGETAALVTGVRVGQTSLRVSARGYQHVTRSVPILVTYEDLQYTIVSPQLSAFKQINTRELFEPFTAGIITASSTADSNPHITWQLNGQTLADTSFQNSREITIDQNNFDRLGFHNTSFSGLRLSVEITSPGWERIPSLRQRLYFDTFFIFSNFNENAATPEFSARKQEVVPTESYNLNQIVQIRASHIAGRYPPDAYEWWVKRDTEQSEGVFRPYRKTEPAVTGGVSFGQLFFRPDLEGTYSVRVYPIIKDLVRRNMGYTVFVGEFNAALPGNNIWGAHMDAVALGNNIHVPLVRWDALAYFSTFEVELLSPDGTLIEHFNSAYDRHRELFTNRTFMVVSEGITIASSFDLRIRGSKYLDWATVSYRGEFATKVAGNDKRNRAFTEDGYGFSAFMPTLERLGELTNFIIHFRPDLYRVQSGPALSEADAANVEGMEVFRREIYLGFFVDEIQNRYYLRGGAPFTGTRGTWEECMFAIGLAFDNYADTGWFIRVVRPAEAGIFAVYFYLPPRLNFNEPPTATENPTRYTKYDGNDALVQFRSTTIMQPGEPLGYEWNTNIIPVTTSCQLYYAFTLGFRPVPVAGSQAEKVYEWARETLRDIIDPSMSDACRIRAIYHFLIFNVNYDHVAADMNPADLHRLDSFANYRAWTIEGVMMDGLAVCDGIAKTFQLFSFMAGVTSQKISGTAGAGALASGHTWNMTFIEGNWYLSDATWGNASDDGVETPTERHLLRNLHDFSRLGGQRRGFGLMYTQAEQFDFAADSWSF